MTQKGDVSVRDRIERSYRILERLQENGQDTVKLRESLGKIEKVTKAAPEKDLDRAITKFEEYLERISGELGISTDITAEDGKGSAEEEPSPSSGESNVKPEEEEPAEEIPIDTGSENPEEQVEVPVESASTEAEVETAPADHEPGSPPSETGITETERVVDTRSFEESPSEPTDVDIPEEMEEAPKAMSLETKASPEAETPKETQEDDEGMISEVEDLDRIARKIGGDTSGIQAHLKAMKDAHSKMDADLFQQYHRISSEWLIQYITSLAPTAVNDMIATIRSVESQYLDIGKQERLDGKIPDITGIMRVMNSRDAGSIISAINDLRTSVEMIEEDQKTLSEDLISEMEERSKEMRSLLNRVVDEEKRTSFKQRIDVAMEGCQEDCIGTYSNFRTLYSDVTGEAANAERRKFEMILQSVEPMIQRISDILGEDSEEHIKLVREKDHLLSRFSSDITGAMEGMGDLLDQSANLLADLEESRTQTLEQGIGELREKLEDIHEGIDPAPVTMILEKSETAMEDNNLELSQTLLEKAQLAFKKLLNISLRKQAEKSLNEVLSNRNDLISLSIDVTPLDEPLEKATASLKTGNMQGFDEQMSILKERLVHMRREELRVEYQKLMIMIMNEMKKLKENDIDVDIYEKKMEDAKDLFLARKDRECVEAQRSLLKDLRKKRLSLVIGDRLDNALSTLKEAEGLLIETEGSKRMMDLAKERMDAGEVEESLDLLTRAQVELEERMTRRTFSMIENEIRELWEDSGKYGLEIVDLEPRIQEAYNMADDERFKEAMEHLYRMRETLSNDVKAARSTVIIEELGSLVKKARSVGLKVATFKAAHTKAKILLDAGDVDAVIELVDRQISSIRDRIENRKNLQSQLDELRGRLIGQEVKIKKLVDSGISVVEIRDMMKVAREQIDIGEVDLAMEKMEELDKMILNMSRDTPEAVEAISDTRDQDEEEKTSEEAIDPDEAKTKLFSLVADIRNEMRVMNTQGKATGEIKRDIETIQNLVIKREYVEAYTVAINCLNRIME